MPLAPYPLSLQSGGLDASRSSSPGSSSRATPVAAEHARKRPRLRGSDGDGDGDRAPAACDQCKLRKIRCDRQQPQCANCARTGAGCTQTSTVPRVNQTKQLREEFSTVLGRLDGIDETLGMLTQLAKQFTDAGQHTLLLPSAQPAAAAAAATARAADHGTETVALQYGGERTYKHPAAMALLKAFSRQLADSCGDDAPEGTPPGGADDLARRRDAATRAVVACQLEVFPFQGPCLQPFVPGDRGPAADPPEALARLAVDGFLRDTNPRIPLFDPAALRAAVDAHYAPGLPPAPQRSTWALILSNIVLLECGLESQAARLQQHPSAVPDAGSTPADGLLAALVRNADSALTDLAPYTRPSCLHVQALLTLALVAHEFHGSLPYENALHAACQVGRMLGLHLPRAADSQRGPDEAATRKRLFRVLYGLDKQRAFMTGDACDLYHFDADRTLWETNADADAAAPRVLVGAALAALMVVWEEMYLKLYTARAAAAGPGRLADEADSLRRLLAEWYEQHAAAMDDDDDASPPRPDAQLAPLRAELRYGYHTAQVLVLRCRLAEDAAAHAQAQDHARTCLRLLIDVGSPGHEASAPQRLRTAALGRMLGMYPAVAFLDLAAFRVGAYLPGRAQRQAPGDVQDVEADRVLLHWVLCLLQRLRHADRPSTYLHRLHAGLAWAAQVLDAVHDAWLLGGLPETPPSAPSRALSVARREDTACGAPFGGEPDWDGRLGQGDELHPGGGDAFAAAALGGLGSDSACHGGLFDADEPFTASFSDTAGEARIGDPMRGRVDTPERSARAPCLFHGLDPWQRFLRPKS